MQAIDSLGPVQPLGDLRTIIGQRGRLVSFVVPRIALDFPDVFDCVFQRGGHELMHLLRIVAFHKEGVQPQPRKNCSNSSCSMRARMVGLLILYPLR